jgi:hypothetical protein
MLNTIETVLKKKGPEYLNQLLNENIVITEKLDTYRILFEKINGELKFFKKDNTELNLVERVLTNIWEDAIIELSIILKESEIPEGLTFGVAYSPVNKPIRLNYENLPKYVLTDVTKRNSSNKVLENFDYGEVNNWAKELKLGRPPVIFEGKLGEDKIKRLIEYGKGNYDNDERIEDIIGKSYSNADIIEGIILTTESQLIQIISYEFELLNEAYQQIEGSRDFYDLTLLRINSFLDSFNFSLMEKKSYLELVCDIFNEYTKAGNISEDLDPKFLSPPSYGYGGELNLLLLENKETISILEKGSKIHEAVFKIMLSSLRKFKRPFGLLRESDVDRFNTFVYFIGEITGENLEKSPKIVQTINEVQSNNIAVKSVSNRIKTDVDNMRVISSIQKAFNPINKEVNKGKQKTVVYVIDAQPITTSHKENMETLSKMWKCPVLLAIINGKKRLKGDKFHLSDTVRRAQLESFADNNQNLVPAFFTIDSWELIEIFEYCRPKYEPIAVITEAGKKSEFSLQVYFEEEVMGGRLGVEKDFNIGEMDSRDSLIAYRAIEDNNFFKFKEITPNPVWGLFDLMVSEYKEWNGSVPSQFEENRYE